MFILKFFLLIIPFVLTVIIKLIVVLSIMRLRLRMSESLDADMAFVASSTSRYINMFWDLELGHYPDQYHHDPLRSFFAAVRGALILLWMLLVSIMPWELLRNR